MISQTKTPVERVVAILGKEDYKPAPKPFVVASVPFDFAATLVGTGRSPDLIVVIDIIVESSELRVRQKIESLARALDVAGSRRPMTVILVGPKPSDPTIEALTRVCRVLPIGTPSGAEAEIHIQDWLAVLLPLRLPAPSETLTEPKTELAEKLPTDINSSLRKALLAAAELGPRAVEDALKTSLEAALVDVDDLSEDAP